MTILHDGLPEPLHAPTSRPVTWPTVPGSAIPVHALPVIVKNNIQLANKPASKPPHPTVAQVLTAIPLGFQFAFNQVVVPIGATNVISSYRVYRNMTANNFSGATLMRTFVHDPTRQGAITVQDSTGGGKNYYYFVTSVDTSPQESSPVAMQAGAITSANANPNTAQALGSTSNPSTTSTTYVVIPEMTLTVTTTGHKVLVVFSASLGFNGFSAQGAGLLAIFKDGVKFSVDFTFQANNGASILTEIPVAITLSDVPTAASHTYDVRWLVGVGSTMNCSGTARTLQVVELG